MDLQHNLATLALADLLEPAVTQLAGEKILSSFEIAQSFAEAPQIELGHFAFPTFPLAKALKLAPPMIAQKLAETLNSNSPTWLKSAVATGPYLNLKLTSAAYGEWVLAPILNNEFFKKDLTLKRPKTMIEYSQPNTHKVLHVGHMRNLCLGDALVRLSRYANQEVVAATYPGDVGTHVAKTLWYLKNHCPTQAPATGKGAWLGELYTLATHKLEDEKGSEKEAQNRTELTAILKQLEEKSGEYYKLWVETREWSLSLMNEAYDWANVKFDRWFYESEVDGPSLKLMQDYLAQGLLVRDQGAVGMDLSEDDLGFCLLIKTDGTGLYATKDVALAKKKFEEFGIEKNIYIVDNRQARHFKQVFKVLEKIGFEQAKNCYHLQYDVVELPDGAMSSRKGNIVPLMTLIHQMEETITERYLEKYRGQWSDEEIKKTATQVAAGAIKYGMIRMDNQRKIVFDMNEWLKLDGETGPYLQYVHARILSMVEKFEAPKKLHAEHLTHISEERLLVKLSRFNDIMLFAAQNLKTVGVCSYLFELGKLFNQFYAECSISHAPTDEIKQARLSLARATAMAMKQGLELCGIEAPRRM